MQFATHQEELEYLQKLGFPTNPLNKKVANLDQAWKYATEIEQQKETLAYPVDGLVIKVNDNQILEKTGVVGKTNRAWSAIKFKADEVTTKLLGVTWQVGRTGKVTPVAELEAVQLAGTTVKRATLHNFQEFVNLDLHDGDFLVIRKAGEIIPEVVQKVLSQEKNQKFVPPFQCPICDSGLHKSNTEIDLICNNQSSCPAQVIGRLSYFSQRNIANIKGLSEKQLAKFYHEFGVSDVADLYDLPFDKILELEGYQQKSVDNLQSSIQEARQIPAHKFLAGLSIEGVGPEVAKLIVNEVFKD
jgi:DNA ligase (NAD+)